MPDKGLLRVLPPAACRLHSLSRPASRTRRTSRVARNFTPTSSSQCRSRVFVPGRWQFHGWLACLPIYLTVLLHERAGPAVRLYCIWRLCTWPLQDLKCVHAPWGFHGVQRVRRYGNSPALDMNNACEHQSPRFASCIIKATYFRFRRRVCLDRLTSYRFAVWLRCISLFSIRVTVLPISELTTKGPLGSSDPFPRLSWIILYFSLRAPRCRTLLTEPTLPPSRLNKHDLLHKYPRHYSVATSLT